MQPTPKLQQEDYTKIPLGGLLTSSGEDVVVASDAEAAVTRHKHIVGRCSLKCLTKPLGDPTAVMMDALQW